MHCCAINVNGVRFAANQMYDELWVELRYLLVAKLQLG